jgi:predicted ATPase
VYAFDGRISTMGHRCLALFALGHPDLARELSRATLEEAHALGHPASLAQALNWAGLLQFAAGEAAGLRRTSEEAAALAAEQGLPWFAGVGAFLWGLALVGLGKDEEGIAEVDRGSAGLEATGSRALINAHVVVAEAHARAGRVGEALGRAAAAAWTEEGPSLWFEAEEHRRLGGLLLSLPGPDRVGEAEARLRRAVGIARAQDARMWELRAARDLARLLRDQGRVAEARDLLAPVYGWFTEGFDLPDLRDARALLDALD